MIEIRCNFEYENILKYVIIARNERYDIQVKSYIIHTHTNFIELLYLTRYSVPLMWSRMSANSTKGMPSNPTLLFLSLTELCYKE
jgi:hypothetical protein